MAPRASMTQNQNVILKSQHHRSKERTVGQRPWRSAQQLVIAAKDQEAREARRIVVKPPGTTHRPTERPVSKHDDYRAVDTDSSSPLVMAKVLVSAAQLHQDARMLLGRVRDLPSVASEVAVNH
jgi:hypothetical protein